jgi:hypothetical protein
MSRNLIASIGAGLLLTASCLAQQAANLPSALITSPRVSPAAQYTSPTQKERLQIYVRHTFGVYSFVEAGMRGGIEQARDSPDR